MVCMAGMAAVIRVAGMSRVASVARHLGSVIESAAMDGRVLRLVFHLVVVVRFHRF
jgi:hypothetical protein